jgi:pyruvate,water dikinase
VPLSLTNGRAVAADRAGPKAATLARLRAAGLPVPDGVVLPAELYRAALRAAQVELAAERVAAADEPNARRLALEVRLGLLRAALDDLPAFGDLVAVRSSALVEGDGRGSLAGQLETFLGVSGRDELATAVRSCWASLWSTRARRYLQSRGIDPARTAVAVLVQPLVPARAAGGALSHTAEGDLVVTAAWGLGPAVAQGDVVPDHYVLRRPGLESVRVEPGRKAHRLDATGYDGPRWRAVAAERVSAPCLTETEVLALARLVLAVEEELAGPVEVEWALDALGFHILQARPLDLADTRGDGALPSGWPVLRGQPASAGRATGPARVVRREADLARVGVGDVLVTRVPGPALAPVLSRVAAVVAELGGSTSHLAALARERGVPAVLGVADATRRLTDGRLLIVDGVLGTVHERPDRP